MVTQVYSLFDKKAEAYGTPFFTVNDATAIRMVSSLVLDRTTIVASNPEDFQLLHLGSFDDGTGELAPTFVRVVTEVISLLPKPTGENDAN